MSNEMPSFVTQFPKLNQKRIKKLLHSKQYKAMVALKEAERRTGDRETRAYLTELWTCVEAYVRNAGYSSKEYDAAYVVLMGNVAAPE